VNPQYLAEQNSYPENRKSTVKMPKTYPDKPAPGCSLSEYWSDPVNHNPKWSWRAEKVAELCEPGSSVCDIGCGVQALKEYLPKDCRYFPADLTQWTDDTELCDINAGRFPESALSHCDTCVMLGVLEYLWSPVDVFRFLRKSVKTLIFTYNVTDWSTWRHPLWINALSIADIEKMLKESAYSQSEVTKLGETAVIRTYPL
jgi:hypothetical protein